MPVRLLANECIEPRVLEHLNALGVDAIGLLELNCGPGLRDRAVLKLAEESGRVLLTYDRTGFPFDDVVEAGHSVIVVSPPLPDFRSTAERVAAAARDLRGPALVVIEPGRIRTRRP